MSAAKRIKIAGTLISIGGSLMFAFYGWNAPAYVSVGVAAYGVVGVGLVVFIVGRFME